MKNKKIIIILSLAILILMIMNVSASENNTCDTISTTDNIEISTTNTNEMSIKNISTKDIKTNNMENNQEKESHDSNSNDYIYNENNTINKSNIPDNTLQKSKQEILGSTNNIEILGVGGSLYRIDSVSGSTSKIAVVFTYYFRSSEASPGDSAPVTAICEGKGGSTTVTKSRPYMLDELVSGSITIDGPFTLGTKTIMVLCGSNSMDASVTISKASTSISITGGDGYAYGSSGTKTFYKGTVNGKQGSISIAGNVAIYRNGNYWKDVSCNENGAFSVTGSSTDLDPNTYAFTCTYKGNDYYSSSNGASRSITVSKGTPTVTSSPTVNTDTYPGKVSVTFTVKNQKGDALSGITLTPSGSKFSSAAGSTNGNGQVTFIVTPLDAGTYSDWKVTTTGNTKYNSVTSSSVGSFTIKKQE